MYISSRRKLHRTLYIERRIIVNDTFVRISSFDRSVLLSSFFFLFFYFYKKRRRGILRVSFRYYRVPVSSSYGWLELLCSTRPRRRAALSWRGRISPRRFCTRPHGTHGIVDSSQTLLLPTDTAMLGKTENFS